MYRLKRLSMAKNVNKMKESTKHLLQINFYMLSNLWLLKLSSSSVSGKNTSPGPSSLRLDFFRFSFNDSSPLPFFTFGEMGKSSPAGVALSPGLRGPGLVGRVLNLSLELVAAPSLNEPLLSLSGDFNLNKFFTFNVLDLLMVSDTEVLAKKVRAGK